MGERASNGLLGGPPDEKSRADVPGSYTPDRRPNPRHFDNRAHGKGKANQLMKPRCIFPVLICLLAALGVAAAAAASARGEWVILTSGEKFQTDRSWQEEGRRKFRLNGLLVSVPESDVARVIVPGTTPADPAVQQRSNQPAPAAEKVAAPPTDALRPSRQERLRNALNLPPPKPESGASTRHASTPTASPAPGKTPAPRVDDPPAAPSPQPSRGVPVFRDLAWGMRPSSMPGLLLSQTDPAYGGVDEFFYPDEDLKLGGAPLNGIVYGFWQNRLYTITIWTDGRPSYEKLREWVVDTYGPGNQRQEEVERRVWYGEGSDRLLEFDETLNTGIFWMRSAKLHARIEQLQTR
jgi:hypothetical protein